MSTQLTKAPRTPFLDALGIEPPLVKMDEIREDARKSREAFKRLIR